MSKSYDVFGVGNALVDIQVPISDALLESLQFPKGIMTLVDEAVQRRVLAEFDIESVSRCAGGSAANTIMGVADFGGKGAYAAKVGGDALGDFFLSDMRKMGVSIEVPQTDGHGGTGTCVVLISADAQRTMLTHLGVSATLGPEDISAAEIAKAKYVYIEGYLFAAEPGRSAAMRTIELAQVVGTKVALTISDPFLINLCHDQFWSLIRGPVDLLFCNLEEARSLVGHEDPIHCAHAIHQHCENVALTMSGEGSLLMHAGEVIPIEATSVRPLDTTGAGDMYAAGILYGITNGLTWKQAGHLASAAAGRIVSQLGARLQHRFTAEEIATLAQSAQ